MEFGNNDHKATHYQRNYQQAAKNNQGDKDSGFDGNPLMRNELLPIFAAFICFFYYGFPWIGLICTCKFPSRVSESFRMASARELTPSLA